MDKKNVLGLGLFGIILVIFSIFSRKIGFHDSYEYITIAKYFAGINNVDLFSGHSLVYPFFISIFLKIWPSFIMLKLVNVLWVFLIALALLLWLRNKKAFILFVFSPLTWYLSIQTTPVLPASFLFLISFIFFHKEKLKYHLAYAGLFLGLSCVFYTPMILVGGIFIGVYFWNRSLKEVLKYFLFIFVGFLPRMILDMYLFSMPIYSLIRYGGANFIVFVGLNPVTDGVNLFSNLGILSILVIISPFLFRLHRLDFKKYKKIFLFLIILSLILLLRLQQITYFLILSPILLILLSKILTQKEVVWHCAISIFLILILTFGFFTFNEETLLKKDLGMIREDYDFDYVIGGPFEVLKLASMVWDDDFYFVWFQDFEASLENQTEIRGYDFDFDSKVPLKDKLVISASFNRYEDKTYENYIFVTKKDFEYLDNLKLSKCYNILCVYEKK